MNYINDLALLCVSGGMEIVEKYSNITAKAIYKCINYNIGHIKYSQGLRWTNYYEWVIFKTVKNKTE